MKNVKSLSLWLMLIMGVSTVAAQTTTLPLNLKFLETGYTRLSSVVPGEFSGSVTSRGFEYRLKDESTWTAIEADAFFLVNLPDLPSGLYEVRAFAVVTGQGTLYSEVYDMQITCSYCADPCDGINLLAPTIANSNLLFCHSENATVADLKAQITGTAIKIYGLGESALSNSTLLETGTYYAVQTEGACEGSRLELTLSVCDCPQILVNPGYNMYTKNPCGCDIPLNTGIGLQTGMKPNSNSALADNIQIPGSGYISYDVYYLHNGAVGRITDANLINKWVKTTESVPSTDVLPVDFGLRGYWWYVARGTSPFTITLRCCCAASSCPPLEATTLESISVSLPAGATVADLKAKIEGGNIKMYREFIGETPLADSELLEAGKYTAGYTTGTPPCDNVSKIITITVTLTDPCAGFVMPAPTIENSSLLFCRSENATVADLKAQITGSAIKIYGQGESALSNSTLLESGTYYAVQTEGKCEGSRLELTLSVCDCPQILIQPGENMFTKNPCGCNVPLNSIIGFQNGMKQGANATLGDNIQIGDKNGVYNIYFMHNGTVGRITNPDLIEKWVASGSTIPTTAVLSTDFGLQGWWWYLARGTSPFTITLRCCCVQSSCPPLEATVRESIMLPFRAGSTIADLKAEIGGNVEIYKQYLSETPLANSELIEPGRYTAGLTTGTPPCDNVSKLITTIVVNTPVDATIESGGTHTFTDAGGNPLASVSNVTYKWEMCTANCGTPSAVWAPAPGTNNQAGYTTGALTDNTYFRRTASASGVAPLVTEVLVSVTVPSDYYFEFVPTICANTFEETVAYYYPEVPTPANWIDRVGTVQFLPFPEVNVRLIDDTGVDGIAKARVVIDNSAIPASWARALAYPTIVVLWTKDEEPVPHLGNTRVIIKICAPVTPTITIKPYDLMGTNTQKPLSSLDLKKDGTPVATANANWISGNTSSVTINGANLAATSQPGVATVTATLKDGTGSATSTIVVLNTPEGATIQSG